MKYLTTVDCRILFCTRSLRLYGYGLLAVALALYLSEVGLTGYMIGLIFCFTLLGDTLISLWLTTRADRYGRKKTLIIGGALMVFAGVIFALTRNPILLVIAATLGVISPNGNEVGPFLSVEQSSLSHILLSEHRVTVFSWYNLFGYLATALGSLSGGLIINVIRLTGHTPLESFQVCLFVYSFLGGVLMLLFAFLTSAIEIDQSATTSDDLNSKFGLHGSHKIVMHLSALFAMDAFGGGLVMQSLMSYWFSLRFGLQPYVLGAIFFGGNVLAGISGLLAGRLAKRFGLINTMVYTHIPSNVFLMLVPMMPNAQLAIGMLLLRFCISQMDVPTRQAYVMAVVKPEERSAAAGITGVARSLGAAMAPLFAGVLLSRNLSLGLPFILAGGIKIVYDLLLFKGFQSRRISDM